MSPSIEQSYYEQSVLWGADLYLQNPHEVLRFRALADSIPEGATSLLDVGAGNGAFLKFLEERGHPRELAGIDRSESAAMHQLCRTRIAAGEASALPYRDGSFDVVSACEVIEHLPYRTYERALAEISRVARTHVLISVPYQEKRNFVRCLLCGTEFPSFFHLRSFDERDLTELLPEFRLVFTLKLRVGVRPFTLDPRNFWRRLRRFRHAAWHGQICPACGYTPPAGAAGSDGPLPLRSRIKEYINDLVPKIPKAKWIVALYQRCSGGDS